MILKKQNLVGGDLISGSAGRTDLVGRVVGGSGPAVTPPPPPSCTRSRPCELPPASAHSRSWCAPLSPHSCTLPLTCTHTCSHTRTLTLPLTHMHALTHRLSYSHTHTHALSFPSLVWPWKVSQTCKRSLRTAPPRREGFPCPPPSQATPQLSSKPVPPGPSHGLQGPAAARREGLPYSLLVLEAVAATQGGVPSRPLLRDVATTESHNQAHDEALLNTGRGGQAAFPSGARTQECRRHSTPPWACGRNK